MMHTRAKMQFVKNGRILRILLNVDSQKRMRTIVVLHAEKERRRDVLQRIKNRWEDLGA